MLHTIDQSRFINILLTFVSALMMKISIQLVTHYQQSESLFKRYGSMVLIYSTVYTFFGLALYSIYDILRYKSSQEKKVLFRDIVDGMLFVALLNYLEF
jgi:hypothetical protein